MLSEPGVIPEFHTELLKKTRLRPENLVGEVEGWRIREAVE